MKSIKDILSEFFYSSDPVYHKLLDALETRELELLHKSDTISGVVDPLKILAENCGTCKHAFGSKCDMCEQNPHRTVTYIINNWEKLEPNNACGDSPYNKQDD